MSFTSWREHISIQMEHNEDSWDNFVACAPKDIEWDSLFEDRWGLPDPFTLWTKDWVYFPVCRDSDEWVACVPRNPSEYIRGHVGV